MDVGCCLAVEYFYLIFIDVLECHDPHPLSQTIYHVPCLCSVNSVATASLTVLNKYRCLIFSFTSLLCCGSESARTRNFFC